MSDDEDEGRNGYEIPFLESDLVYRNTVNDIINVSKPIFDEALNVNSPKWKGATFLHLYDHQRALIREMMERETALRNGMQIEEDQLHSHFAFLGDKAATGKSWTTIGYIKACKDAGKQQHCTYMQQLSQANIFSVRHTVHNHQTNLILVPSVLLQQWRSLLEEEEGLTYMCIRRNSQINCEELVENIRAVDVVLVPNTLFPTLCDRLLGDRFTWTRVFIDDWASIPLAQTRATLLSQFTWLLTGDWFPYLFSDVHYNMWYMQTIANSIPESASTDMRTFFSDLLSRPPNNVPVRRSFFYAYVNNHPNRDRLIVKCNDDFLRSSINIQEPKLTLIPYCGDTIMRFLYALCSRGLRSALDAENYVRALELVGATFMNDQEWVEHRKTISRSEVHMDACPICFDRIEMPTLTPCCQNFFCAKCLLQTCQSSGKNGCPICRSQISGQRLIVVSNRAEEQRPYLKKIECLVRELKARPGKSHLIYFPCEPMYGLLRTALRAADLNFDVLTGSRDVLRRKTERFIQGATDIIVIFNRHQILNINLPNVTTIFIYPDTIDETDKMRLIHRTQQIGRNEPLEIVQFSNCDEQQSLAASGPDMQDPLDH